MKNKKLALLIILLLLFVGCFNSNEEVKENNKEKENEKKEEVIVDEIDEIEKKVNETLAQMSLDEKIGQMIMVFYRASEMDNTLKSALEDVQPGGFILFSENFTTYENTLKLVKEIKSYVKIPMFISIDEEGGNVQRLTSLQGHSVTDIPYMYNLGLKNDEELSYNVGKVIAEELKVFGVNMDFAPVIDVYSNPNNTVIGKRSFGTTAEVVSKLGISLAKGLEDNGVIPVYKHFPGHGNTAVDSHEALPIVDKTKEALLDLDLIPFINAIENDASVIMIGHLAVPSITGDNTPASLSKVLITDFLKNELGFNGLVITDALEMKALTNYYSENEICAKAVEAGVDILLMPSSSRTCLKSVQDGIKNGTISEERIDESVKKILRLKYEKIVDDYDNYLPVDTLNSKEHQEIVNKAK